MILGLEGKEESSRAAREGTQAEVTAQAEAQRWESSLLGNCVNQLRARP